MNLHLTRTIHKGFTLIELMIVIAIIAVLATIAIPSYQNYTKKAAITELMQAAAPYKSDVELCVYNQGNATSCSSGSNGIQAVPTSSPSKYVKSIAVTSGVITIAGDGTLNGTGYTLTPTVPSSSNTSSTTNITWQASCTGDTALFPAGFCS